MAKFNTATTKNAGGKGFLGTINTQTINHQGGTGFLRDEKSELFLAAVSDFMDLTPLRGTSRACLYCPRIRVKVTFTFSGTRSGYLPESGPSPSEDTIKPVTYPYLKF